MQSDCSPEGDSFKNFRMVNVSEVVDRLKAIEAACAALTQLNEVPASAFLYMVDTSTINVSLNFTNDSAALSFKARLAD